MTFLPLENPDEPTGSHYVNQETARRAIELAGPLIAAGLADAAIVGSGHLAVVVMNPGLAPGYARFEDAILHEQEFGDSRRRDADYVAFARAKARTSWLSGMDSQRLQQVSPHLLHAGDTLLAGGVWLEGIVVGVSGAFPIYDEVYAGTIAFFLRALARQARENEAERPILRMPQPQLVRT